MNTIEGRIGGIVDLILSDYSQGRDIDRVELSRQPDKAAVTEIVNKLLGIVYPGYRRDKHYRVYNVKHNLSMLIEDVMYNLSEQIAIALTAHPHWAEADRETVQQKAGELTTTFFTRIPQVRALAQTDVEAAYQGDPAAKSLDEIIFSYPGLFAITVHRLAHELYLLDVPIVPRMMNEYAHGLTGVDIHPGATIGHHFFMDHGTGIVIGETTCIGDHVRLYQGVTLGSLTTRGGQNLRGTKRHPTIEDRVTIYAGASILGGETVIGAGTVVGSNAFIISSVGPNMTVQSKAQELRLRQRQESSEY